MTTRTAAQRGFNLDYMMWLFTRISGLAIVMMALVGVAVAFYLGARTQMDMPTLLRWTFSPTRTMSLTATFLILSLDGLMPTGRSCRCWLSFLPAPTVSTDCEWCLRIISTHPLAF